MNYRHAYHAGSFTDIIKHIILARIIVYLKRKDKPFRVFDTHSGIGRYDLNSKQAQDTGEWLEGIKRIREATVPDDVARLIGPWLDIVNSFGPDSFPGSPRVSHGLLRPHDRLSLYELHEEDHATLAKEFDGDYQTRVNNGDGWNVSVSPIPPKEGRGLILVDPPFEDGQDFDRIIKLMSNSHQRWAGGVVAAWYPVKKRDHTDEWLGTLKTLKFPKLLNVELYVQAPFKPGILNGCGMVILNPPFVLREELETIMPWLANTLQQEKGSGYRIQDLSTR